MYLILYQNCSNFLNMPCIVNQITIFFPHYTPYYLGITIPNSLYPEFIIKETPFTHTCGVPLFMFNFYFLSHTLNNKMISFKKMLHFLKIKIKNRHTQIFTYVYNIWGVPISGPAWCYIVLGSCISIETKNKLCVMLIIKMLSPPI